MKPIFLNRSKPWRWLWLSLGVILLDQATKYWAMVSLDYQQPMRILSVLDFRLVYNTGAAYGLFGQSSGWHIYALSAISIVVSIVLTVWLLRLQPYSRSQACALALLIGGALGNVIDRIRLHYVIDFISVHWGFHYFAIFNVADAAVTVGAVLLMVNLLFFNRQK